MEDFIFPIPKEKLIARYQKIFQGFKKGQSCLHISLPHNNRAAWLKFILRNETGLLDYLIDTTKYFFIEIDESKLTPSQFIKLLAIKLGQLPVVSKEFANLTNENSLSEESYILFAKIEHNLNTFPKDKTIVLFLPRAEELFSYDSGNISLIAKIANIRRSIPQPLFCLFLGGNPTLLEKRNEQTMSPLWQICSENICFTALLDETELLWTKCRIEHFTGRKISKEDFGEAKDLSGGHIRLFMDALEKVSSDSTIDSIWSGIPNLAKQNWNQKFIANYEPLRHFGLQTKKRLMESFPPKTRLAIQENLSNISLPQLTAQEKIIFDYLSQNETRIVTRDELAQVIWGKLWQEKYSDWAIDRSTSKLRKKLRESPFNLISLRGRGYRLVQQ